MRGWGWLFIAAGVGLMIWGLAYDASVPSGGYGAVMNLGLIAEKQIIFSLGGVLFLAGIVLIAAARIGDALSGPRAEAPSEPAAPRPGYTVGPGLKGPARD